MVPIYPVTALQKRQSEVKRAAREDIVRITENGVGAYVFCSEEVFERKMAEVAEKAAYEARLSEVIERGRADVEAGRVYSGMDEVRAAIDAKVQARG